MLNVGAPTVTRISLIGSACLLALFVGLIILLGTIASAALPWVVGALLIGAVVSVVVLGFHAGGHGWFVPVPVLVLAAVWAITASAGSWSSPLAWTLAAFAFASAVLGALLVLPALAYRHHPGISRTGKAALVGATGTALSALSPRGIASVNNETWTVESMSGDLPAGAPVHVAKVEGVRLLVWSEAGGIPGPDALHEAGRPARQSQEKEEP